MSPPAWDLGHEKRHLRDAAVLVGALAALAASCRGPSPTTSDGAIDAGLTPADVAPDLGRDETSTPDASPDQTVTPDAPPDAPALLGYPPSGHQMLRGHFVFGNELHAFQSCNLPALTWVELEGNEPGIDKLGTVVTPCTDDAGLPNCPVRFFYVELDANVIGPCPGAPVGHLGKYACSLTIDNLRVVSASSPPDCPPTMPAYP